MVQSLEIPGWLSGFAVFCLILAVISFLIIAVDVYRHPQKMKIMNIVWPVTALFGSVIWLAAYWHWGRTAHTSENKQMTMPMKEGQMMMPQHSMPVSVFIGTCHCGAGCSLADLIVEWLLFFFPSLLVVGGYQWLFHDSLFAKFVWAYVVAYLFGVSFQYFAIAPMKHLGLKEGILEAMKADTLSLTAWQVGMYGMVAFCQLYLFPHWLGGRVPVDLPVFWLMMQVAMLTGFCTAYPMNWFLIHKGVKERM